jgi:outer membrane receptor for ferrienterochelin and colicin
MDPNLIESMNVLKGNALEKYGEDGANGVIEIITKKNKPLKSAK